jgi:hypothetical protein
VPSGVNDGRITLALFDDGTTNELFVSIVDPNTQGLLKMLKSTDGGGTFTDLTASANPPPDYLGQGNYATTLIVDPFNPDYVYAAGSNRNNLNIESFDGGIHWQSVREDINGSGPHTDAHAVAFDAAGNLIDGDDGGVSKLSNPTSDANSLWSSLNNNLQITQFYGVAVDPTDASVAYGGS